MIAPWCQTPQNILVSNARTLRKLKLVEASQNRMHFYRYKLSSSFRGCWDEKIWKHSALKKWKVALASCWYNHCDLGFAAISPFGFKYFEEAAAELAVRSQQTKC